MNPLLLTDGYKLDHRRQYPEGTELVYSNWTPRGSRIKDIDHIVFFGLQYFIKKYVIEDFNKYFFNRPKQEVLVEYERRINNYLGSNKVGVDHISDLHDLGYIPMKFKALPEGVSVPLRVPMFTMCNTKSEFFWLTNYFETLLSTTLWMMCNSATIAKQYRLILNKYAKETSSITDFVDWQGHDFSMRGMSGVESAMMSGASHLLSFKGTDTIPAIDFLEKYYNANSDVEVIGGSVPATEHSVMCMGTNEGEQKTIERLITEVYPSGVVSIVSDTWDLWKVINEYLPNLKEKITSREGKLVVRPDSGDPVDIICGLNSHPDIPLNINSYDDYLNNKRPEWDYNENEFKGVVELLWEVFGGVVNDKGYKELDSHIGVIYGDSITLERAKQICERLKLKGFASTNVVFGVGSFTYQYNTRDTFGFAMKATYGEVNGEGREIYKDPITDNGEKKSAKGLLKVGYSGGDYFLEDQVDNVDENLGELRTVFKDGDLYVDHSLSEIRSRIKGK